VSRDLTGAPSALLVNFRGGYIQLPHGRLWGPGAAPSLNRSPHRPEHNPVRVGVLSVGAVQAAARHMNALGVAVRRWVEAPAQIIDTYTRRPNASAMLSCLPRDIC
jgi:hypothetical protein